MTSDLQCVIMYVLTVLTLGRRAEKVTGVQYIIASNGTLHA